MKIIPVLSFVLLLGCSGSPDDPVLAPVFAIMCDDIDPSEPPHQCCTGFAMGGQVVTANHCVPNAQARIVSRDQWVHTASDSDIGTVVARDAVRDIAWMSSTGPVEEQLLRSGGDVELGTDVGALTISGAKTGRVFDRAGVFWRTKIDADVGDSGAAIVDASGAAVGVLSRCTTMRVECDPGTGIFAELPR